MKTETAQQKLSRQIIAGALVIQAVLIGAKGNLRVLSGDPLLDVIPSMIAQGVELILKAQRAQKSIEKSDRKSDFDQ